MKIKNRITSTLLATLLTLAMIVTYLPVTMMAYAADNSGSVEEAAPTKAASNGATVLAFTSDTHNQSDNQAANRLGTWIDTVESKVGGKIDAFGFGGDMAGMNASPYWDLTQADMNQLKNRDVTGVYTTGNHEISLGGDFSYSSYTSGSYSSTETKGQFQLNKKGAEGANYIIYCLGSVSSSQSYSTQNQISTLTSFLNSVGNDKPIFIITHFPLHYYSGRTTSGASDMIDALNNAVTNNGQTIVFLWGHNHSMSDTYYDQIYGPGGVDSIQYGSSSSNSKTIKFYYGGAGCMSDSEYGGGSASVKGKGLAVTITPKGDTATMDFTYYNASGTDVTESNSIRSAEVSIKEVEPVPVSGVSITSESSSVKVGKSLKLGYKVTPSDATIASVSWSSSNENVASVDKNGNVIGKAEGKATITLTINDGITKKVVDDNIAITVEPRNASSDVTFVQTDTLEADNEYIIANGDTGSVYVVSNEAGSSRQLKGISASVVNGKITLTEEEADKAVFNSVSNSNSTQGGIWLTNGGKYLYADSNNGLRLADSSTQTNSDNRAKSWHYRSGGKDLLWFFKDTSSSDGYTDTSQIYKYYLEWNSSGVFTDNHVSTTSLSNSSNLPKIYIFERGDGSPIPVTGVTLDKTSLDLSLGKTAALTATVAPARADNKAVTWKSSNTSVATVSSSGVVTGVAPGNATITVTTEDGGYTATCAVKVSTVVTKDYVQTDTLEAGKEYIIVNGNSGSVYVVSNEAGGSRELKGISVSVVNGTITLTEDEAEKAEFSAVTNSNSTQGGVYLMNGGKYLYADSNNGLRLADSSTQTNSDNRAKSWHYRSGGKDLLWFFKDTSSSDGYTDTSQIYKYYLEWNSSGVFTDNHVSTTSLSNSSNLPKVYLFTKDDTHTHKYGEPSWEWAADYSSATAKFTCVSGDDTQTVTDSKTDETEVSAADCTNDKVVKYTASVTFNGTSYSDTKDNVKVEGTALGHDWGEWVPDTEAGVETSTCLRCGETETRPIGGHTHHLTAVAATEATCKSAGNIAYWICNKGDDPCGKYFSDAEGKNEIEKGSWVIPATNDHTLTLTQAVEPTCTEAGNKAYYTCSVCGKFFDGEDGITEVEKDSWVIEALGHDWSDWAETKPMTDKEDGEEARTCKVCGEVETRIVYRPGYDPDQKGKDGTAIGEGASAAAADKAITSLKSDSDPKGSKFGKLTLNSPKQTTKSISLKWTKVSGAKKYVIYANKCGKTNKPKKLATITKGSTVSKTVKKVAGKAVKKGTYYKFIIVALDKDNNVITTSKIIHVATKGGKVGNHKSVTVAKSVLTKAKSLKKGKTLKLNAKAVAQSKKLTVKKHVAVRYESSNTKIATVSSSGKITAKKKGTCYVYAFAQNGVFKKVKVVVK